MNGRSSPFPDCRQFSIVNPTNKPYSYEWRCVDSKPSPFKCHTPNRSILPGKKVEVSEQSNHCEISIVMY